MTRAEMLARISSHELTAWLTLFNVQTEEEEQRQQRARDLAESGDGKVHEYGRPGDDDVDEPDDDEEDGDGAAE